MSLKRDLDRMLCRVSGTGFTIQYWDGERISYGHGAPQLTLRLPALPTVKWMLGDVRLRLPEAYVSGDLQVDGDLRQLLYLCYQVDEGIFSVSPWRKTALALAGLRRRNSLAGARANVSHHYDLSNEFFSTWLDEGMSYSCAYFEQASDGLESAQRQKLRHICGKLQLERSEERRVGKECRL